MQLDYFFLQDSVSIQKTIDISWFKAPKEISESEQK
jgi:hypothetical protein